MSRWTPQYHSCCKLQNKILAMTEDKKITPTQMASLVTAYDKLEERKRILRMKPLPKAQDVAPREKPRPRATFTE